LAGKRLLNTPRHAGSLWIKWEANGPDASGPSVGFGAFAAGPRWGDDENTFVLPGYVRLDALAAYHWRVAGGQVVAQFNVDNLLNKTYYESADADTNAEPRLSIYPAKPLTVLGSIRLEF
jgi:iron complex outermembrane receptor protein